MLDPELGWTTERLALEPLEPRHAAELQAPLADPALSTFTGDAALTLAQLTDRFTYLQARRSPDGAHVWANWALRHRETGAAIGYVQATLPSAGPGEGPAEVAWVVATPFQRQGIAREAAAPLVAGLLAEGWTVVAHIHPDHVASRRVAAALGFQVTDRIVDGEQCWMLTC